ncbi:hypothetical protein Nepgr_031485 [Nepenthes gracilis]|uniref:Cytochrome P450 n=1 Tax=Nepenthes gracilis TaxID=150966 RepID=A0AAD3TIZ0_NEPGR|nr:hypothetical protein Nepgr_031485 [Nepenthes gracilis]
MHPILVVSNWKLAEECLANNDKVFLNRFRTLAVEQLGYDSAMFGFSPYGPYWRELRKIVTVNLLSNHKLEQLKYVRIFEGMIFGGTDTTTTTLIWALSLLLNNRHVLKKVLDEFDTTIGKERLVNDSDMENLVYLQAIIKDTMQLYPAAPLFGPREAINNCNISGYHVRAGTRLFVNIHKIHRDPPVWLDPCEFCPEIFLATHKHIDVRG